jgi:nucleoside-diphosphate-sugar epimerase
MKSILVTGNLGYIGSVLTEELQSIGYHVVGFDIGYFKDCLIAKETNPHKQIIKDLRDIDKYDLNEIDGIIHLAGLSNDPLGELEKNITNNINYLATMKFANLAKQLGIKRFVYASTQSLYGISNSNEELDEDLSKKNPITEYAKSKWLAEIELNKLNSNDFNVCSFRPSTVFGKSPRLRCDIVYNNFVASAFTSKKILIKSDGSPFRPVIHIKDVCMALIAGLKAPSELIAGKSFNVGIMNGNYSIKKLATTVQNIIPDCDIQFTNEENDPRTYKVSFNKILNELKDFYKPTMSLVEGAHELIDFFKEINFTKDQFLGSQTNRIKKIEELMINNVINNKLQIR